MDRGVDLFLFLCCTLVDLAVFLRSLTAMYFVTANYYELSFAWTDYVI